MRLVLCFDGTWNEPHQKTNVWRFYESVLAANVADQKAVYFQGVGTEGSRFQRTTAGLLGTGLDKILREGYAWLVENYIPGDEISIVGFSRGAFTARSLVGMIRKSGLVRSKEDPNAVRDAYRLYRTRKCHPNEERAVNFRARYSHERLRIRFLGVWDTVGTLGIPARGWNRLTAWRYRFHDAHLSSRAVERAYHALAIDEHRSQFKATMWTRTEDEIKESNARNQIVEQRWFVGAHGNVGGGYGANRRLSDATLRWMQEQALDAGLVLNLIAPPSGDYAKTDMVDSYREFWDPKLRWLPLPEQWVEKRRCYRPIDSPQQNQTIDASVDDWRRNSDLAYAPKNEKLPPIA